MKSGKAAIGVDVGGTNTKIGVISPEGRVLAEAEFPTEPRKGPQDFVRRIGERVQGLHDRFDVRAMGFGLAGDVDSEGGSLRFAPNLRAFEGFDFKRSLRHKTGLYPVIENDANAAVWGGYVLKLKRKAQNVLGVTLGTGVGGGVILEGRLYRGSTGSAGEIGHAIVETGGRICRCGRKGCLEAYAGSYGIAQTAREVLAESPEKGRVLMGICPDLKSLEPRHLSLAADRGDPAARDSWERTARYLSRGLTNMVLVLNVDVVLILGGISRAGKWVMEPLKSFLKLEPFRTPFSHVRVRLADGSRDGWIGAALLALERDVH